MARVWWQPLAVASATRSTFSNFDNKWPPPWDALSVLCLSRCDLTRSYSLPFQGNQYNFCNPLNCTCVILGKWECWPPCGTFESPQWRGEGAWVAASVSFRSPGEEPDCTWNLCFLLIWKKHSSSRLWGCPGTTELAFLKHRAESILALLSGQRAVKVNSSW